MNLRTKIMAGFANLEADLRTQYGKRVDDEKDSAYDMFQLVVGAHDIFIMLDDTEQEPITIEVDAAVGHAE